MAQSDGHSLGSPIWLHICHLKLHNLEQRVQLSAPRFLSTKRRATARFPKGDPEQ